MQHTQRRWQDGGGGAVPVSGVALQARRQARRSLYRLTCGLLRVLVGAGDTTGRRRRCSVRAPWAGGTQARETAHRGVGGMLCLCLCSCPSLVGAEGASASLAAAEG